MGQTIISPEAKGRELKRDDITCKITYCAVGKNILYYIIFHDFTTLIVLEIEHFIVIITLYGNHFNFINFDSWFCLQSILVVGHHHLSSVLCISESIQNS